MSLETRLAAIASRIGQDIKALRQGKANLNHNHTIADLPVSENGSSSSTQLVRADDSRLDAEVFVAAAAGRPPGAGSGAALPVAASWRPLTNGGLFTLDGVALQEGDRVLVHSGGFSSYNGLYTASSGPWSYAPGISGPADLQDRLVNVQGGASWAGLWRFPSGSGSGARIADVNHAHTTAQITGLDTALSSKADLVGGIVSSSQIPSRISATAPSLSGDNLNNAVESGWYTVTSETLNAPPNLSDYAGSGVGSGYEGVAEVLNGAWGRVVTVYSHADDRVFQKGGGGGPGWYQIDTVAWAKVSGKPAAFPPSTHTHAVEDVDGLQGDLDQLHTDVWGIELPTIGEPFMGGYFAGIIDTTKGNVVSDDDYQVGQRYALIVSPKSLEQDSLEFSVDEGVADPGTRTLWDGLSATAALAASGPNRPAADYCYNLPYPQDGGSRWYLPALDEVQLLYANLKPSDETNGMGPPRPAEGGFPSSGIAFGQNRSSDPLWLEGHTLNDPAQTSVAAFVDGGAQSLTSGFSRTVMSSTEWLPELYFNVDVGAGLAKDEVKWMAFDDILVRPVRRLPLAELKHDHDERYYTRPEVDSALAGKAATGHTHTTAQVEGLQDTLGLKLDKTGGTVTGDLTLGDADNDRVFERSLVVETHNRNTVLGYTTGRLTSVTERTGTTAVRTTTLNYTGERLTSTVEVAGGRTITTTLNYDGAGTLTGVTRSVS